MAVTPPIERRNALRGAAVGATFLGGLAFAPPRPASAATFRDISRSPFRTEIEWMASHGIARGWSDGTFRPLEPIKRDAMAAFIHRFAGAPALPGYRRVFTDVSTRDVFWPEIEWMNAQNIGWGWVDGTFRPYHAIQRDAMAAFLYRLLDQRLRQHGMRIDVNSVPLFRDVPRNHVFAREIRWMRAAGIATGWSDGTYRPRFHVNREGMAAFLHRAAQLADQVR